MHFHWLRVYGLGFAVEFVATAHDSTPTCLVRREVAGKVYIGPLLVNFLFPVTGWRLTDHAKRIQAGNRAAWDHEAKRGQK